MTAEIEQAVFEHINKGRSGIDPLDAHTLLSSLGMDSMRIVEIIFELETRFGAIIDEDQLAYLTSVGDIIALFACGVAADTMQHG